MPISVSNPPDHDLLIALNVKVDRLSVDVRDNHTDNEGRVTKIETRLDAIDKYHAGIDLPHFQTNSAFVDDLRSSWKVVVTMAGGIFFVLQIALDLILKIYFKL